MDQTNIQKKKKCSFEEQEPPGKPCGNNVPGVLLQGVILTFVHSNVDSLSMGVEYEVRRLNSPLKTSLNSPGGAWMMKSETMRTCKNKMSPIRTKKGKSLCNLMQVIWPIVYNWGKDPY